MSADRPPRGNGGGAGPFSAFAAELVRHDGRRAAIDALYRAPETEVVPALVAAAELPPAIVEQARAMARRLVDNLTRAADARPGAGADARIRPLQPGRRRADVHGGSAAAHPRRRHRATR